MKADKKNIAALMARGFTYYQKANYKNAVEDFFRVIELNPEAAGAFNNRGYNRFMLGDSKDALKDYDEAIKLAPNYELTHQNRAWQLATVIDADLCNPAEAVKSGEAACKLSNYGSLGDLSAYAATLAANEEFEAAIGWQEKAVELAPENMREFSTKMLERYKSHVRYASPKEMEDEAAKTPKGKTVATK